MSQDRYDKIARDNDAWQDKDFPGTLDTRGVAIGVTPLPSADESFLDEKFGQQLAHESTGIRGALVRMVNDSPNDKELRGELKDVTQESESVTVAGHAARVTYQGGDWLVEIPVIYEDGSEEVLQWEGSDRSAVLVDAAAWLRAQLEPTPVTPSETDLLRVSRLAASGQLGAALTSYLEACFPNVKSQAEGQRLFENPSNLPTINRAVLYVWTHGQPNFSPALLDVNFADYVAEYAAGRPYTIQMVQTAWEQFKNDASMGRVREALREPTPDEIVKGLEELSDDQVDLLRRASLNAYHKQSRGAR